MFGVEMPPEPPIPDGREPLTAEGFQVLTNVSRETLVRLGRYLDLLTHWQTRINLVGRSTLNDPWRRHFLDSAQLIPLLPPNATTLTDLGSGAGFPGLVLSIVLGVEAHLIESDARKGAFLREAARSAGARATIHTIRIEKAQAWASDVVVARALAPVSQLLDYAWPFVSRSQHPQKACLFLKSENCDQELTAAKKNWSMRVETQPSITDLRSCILRIQGLTPEARTDGRHNDHPGS
jgi:16S rRNA (guanine527-N7)-methyltransferase